MQKAAIFTALMVLVVGGMLQERASGRTWGDVFVHGATRQWLAVVIVLATLLTMADLGAGALAVVLAVLITAGYLFAAAGTFGNALQSAIQAEWGT